MSKIVINLHTDKISGDITIEAKAECNLNELEVATGFLMGQLASGSTTGWEVLSALMVDIEKAMVNEDKTRES